METTYSVQATKLRNGWENELDHQGDFGKMGARNWRPMDGRAAIVLMRIRVTPGHTGILPMR